jgi:hypothetical protein
VNAGWYLGSAAVVIAGNSIAAIIAAVKHGGNSAEKLTFVIGDLQKGNSINGIVNRPIGHGRLHFPLWIKVPTTHLLLAIYRRRYFSRR